MPVFNTAVGCMTVAHFMNADPLASIRTTGTQYHRSVFESAPMTGVHITKANRRDEQGRVIS